MSDLLVVNEIFLSLQGESTWAGLPCIFIRLTGCALRCSYCDTAYAFNEGEAMSVEEVRNRVHRLATPFRTQSPASGDANLDVRERHDELGAARWGQHALPFPVFSLGERENRLRRGLCRLPLVELTGGEPLLQDSSLPLMKLLCDDGFAVLLETSGAFDIAPVDARVHRIMDLKCPSSGETERNRWENLRQLKQSDEVKFVVGTREDYEWTRNAITEHDLASVCPLLISWAAPITANQRDKSLKPIPPGQTSITRQQLAERVLADALPVRFQLQMHKFIWPADRRGV